MSAPKDGGPAFPYSALTPSGPHMYEDSRGMSLRDYFAAKAMQGWLSSFDGDTPHPATLLGDGSDEEREAGALRRCTNLAAHAYEIADAMLAEREREQ